MTTESAEWCNECCDGDFPHTKPECGALLCGCEYAVTTIQARRAHLRPVQVDGEDSP